MANNDDLLSKHMSFAGGGVVFNVSKAMDEMQKIEQERMDEFRVQFSLTESYASDVEDAPDEELEKSPDDVKRVKCPQCHSDEYVLPLRLEGFRIFTHTLDDPLPPERYSPTNIDAGYRWDCRKCKIHFRLRKFRKDYSPSLIILD